MIRVALEYADAASLFRARRLVREVMIHMYRCSAVPDPVRVPARAAPPLRAPRGITPFSQQNGPN